jgi:hypothetical protein
MSPTPELPRPNLAARRRRAPALTLLLLAAAVGVACTTPRQGAEPAAVPPPAAEPSAVVPHGEPAAEAAAAAADLAAAPAEGEDAAGEEPAGAAADDREWLVDGEGKRYFIDRIVKDRYTRISEDVVRPYNMPALKVEREDDEYFYIRVYETQHSEVWNPHRDPTPEQLARYEADPLPEVDVLRFAEFGDGLPRRGQWRNGFALGDVDGDGHVDLVHGPARKAPGSPHIFLGDDAGHWRRWDEARFPPAPYDYGDAEVADFDGDGRLDLAFGFHLLGAFVLAQRDDGEFVPWNEGIALRTDKDAQIDFSGREVVATDWNGDGLPDVVVLSEGPASMPREAGEEMKQSPSGVRVYVNRGDGTWRAADSTYQDRSFGDVVEIADLDGDGVRDMVTGSRAIGYHELVKLGKQDGGWRAAALDTLPEQSLVWSLAAGDFDGDGLADLAVGYRDNQWGVRREALDLLLNRSRPGSLEWERRLIAVGDVDKGFGALAGGDVDGDGELDLVAADDVGAVHVFLGDGEGNLRRERSPELAPPASHRHCAGYEVRLRDLDGDGRDEIVAGFAGEPGGEQALLGLMEKRCPDRGALRAWSPAPAAGERPDQGR